jgi:alpha-methylacyl-CoA racemase
MEVNADAKRTGPLAGVRVVEIGAIGPAPYACMLLSDLGARVTRVDRIAPDVLSGGGDPRFDFLLRGRERIAVDLKSKRGRDIVLRLAEESDVLVEGFRPGVAERLGVGPSCCWERNPRLVYARMTGWGQAGPLAAAAGHDVNYIALTGALHAIGAAGGPPVIPLNLLGDFGGGSLFLVVGVLSALWEAARSGRGQIVDAAMVDGAASLMTAIHAATASGFWRDERGTNLLDGAAPFYTVYETLDGRFVAVGAIEPKFFAVLVEKLGLEASLVEQQYDRSKWLAIRETIASVFRTKTRSEWCAELEGGDACVTPVLGLREVVEHPHVTARKVFESVDGVAQPAPAPRFSRTPSAIAHGAVPAGADTRRVLIRLGFAQDEVDEMQVTGVVGPSDVRE